MIVHDGSYMPDVTTEVSLAGVYVYCTRSKRKAKCMVAEKSCDASNYRAEILGAIVAQLIIRAASHGSSARYQSVKIYCDNLGVLSHGSNPSTSLGENQAQADLLRCLKQLVRENPMDPIFGWVEGHAVERKGWALCLIQERLNDRADNLAKRALIAGYAADEYTENDLTFEEM